jgi:hypothetical protein
MNGDATGPLVWALLDDRAGNRSQCLGVVEALGLAHRRRELRYRSLAALPNALLGASFLGLTADARRPLTPPWPAVVIGVGRRTAPVGRRIKHLAGGGVLAVQIMDPGSGRGDFDLVAVPRHDGATPGANVMSMTGAPHGLTAPVLAEARETWAPRLAGLPAPRIAVIVGGRTRRRPFGEAMARQLGKTVDRMAGKAGGSLMVSTSRRTGAAEAALLGEITAPAEVYRWGDAGENPYRGYLAVADAIVVTGDSVSMCSEACAGTGPVYIFAPEGAVVDKHARLHRELYDAGLARPLAEGGLGSWSHPPLNAAADVAAEIRRRLEAPPDPAPGA